MTDFIRITRGDNPYQREVQGKANEPITVAALLDRSRAIAGARDLAYSLEEIVERLDRNAPRVAVIGGSPPQPPRGPGDAATARPGGPHFGRGGGALPVCAPGRCGGT